MTFERKIEILTQLGAFLKASIQGGDNSYENLPKEKLLDFKERIQRAKHENAWFTEDSVKRAIQSWANSLEEKQIKAWLNKYEFQNQNQTTGVIMAGNIPLVGLHDAICVLVSGHNLKAKLSSKDSLLMTGILKLIAEIAPEMKGQIQINERLNGIDNLIATGSDNSARYFDYYFKNANRIIRKNRTSVAVLSGQESEEDLKNLAHDIFTHFGLGCRNVTKVYLPSDFDLDRLFQAFYPYKHLAEHNKYANNYDYNKAVYLLNKIELVENGFLLMKEDQALHSPVAVLLYERYEDLSSVKENLKEQDDQIQCVVSNLSELNPIAFGMAQQPELANYADGVDTLQFLGQKIKA